MHIIHLCRLFAPHIGGVETHVAQVAQIQRQRGHQVTVVTTQHDSKVPVSEQLKNGVTVIRLPHQFSLQKLQTWRWVMAHSAIFRQADVVQVHDIFWWLLPIFWQNRTKIITTFHGWETHWPVAQSARLQRQFFNMLSVAAVHVGGWIQSVYGDVPDVVMYGGVEQRFLRLSAPKISAKKKLRLVYVGRLEPDLAIGEYIAFVQKLQSAGYSVQMTWVGDGSRRDACAAVGTVVGWQEDTTQWLRDADVVCASSYLSMLQAQAASRVVISLYTNELKRMYLETFTGSQFCIISDSGQDAATKLSKLLKTPEALQALQTGAHQFAATQTWERVADTYEELWHRLG